MKTSRQLTIIKELILYIHIVRNILKSSNIGTFVYDFSVLHGRWQPPGIKCTLYFLHTITFQPISPQRLIISQQNLSTAVPHVGLTTLAQVCANLLWARC